MSSTCVKSSSLLTRPICCDMSIGCRYRSQLCTLYHGNTSLARLCYCATPVFQNNSLAKYLPSLRFFFSCQGEGNVQICISIFWEASFTHLNLSCFGAFCASSFLVIQDNREISLGRVQAKYKGGDGANTFLLF